MKVIYKEPNIETITREILTNVKLEFDDYQLSEGEYQIKDKELYIGLEHIGRIDYIELRRMLRRDFIQNYDSISLEGKLRLLEFFIFPREWANEEVHEKLEIDEKLVKDGWKNIIHLTRSARYDRWELLREKISFYLNDIESLMFFNDVKEFKDLYIDANLPHLELWFKSGENSVLNIDFTDSGFESTQYFRQEFKDIALKVLEFGCLQDA